MAYDGESLIATAIERLNENMLRMDERQQKYQEKTDAKLDKMGEVLGKLVYIDTEVKEGNKRVHHRIDDVEKKIDRINEAHNNGGCSVFREYIAHNEGLNIDDRLKTLENKGSKRWEVAVNKLIEWAILFVIGAVLLKFGVSK